MKYKIPFIKPLFPAVAQIASDYEEILAANWFTNFGPFEQKFSARINEYIGDGFYAATFSSATAALMASLLAVLGRGDATKYIVMPSFTFAAGADAIQWCGYLPIFVDIESAGLQMDIEATEELLKSTPYHGKVAAILFCNAFGVGTTNIDRWESLARETGLPLIIDSAAGFGSLYETGRKVGSAGFCEIFSFHATKPFAIGEGGAVVSRDKAFIDTLKSIQNFGFEDRRAIQLGFNGKLQEINAAIGLRQFEVFEGVLHDRKSVFAQYKAQLNTSHFRLQENAENASLCFAAVIVKQPAERDSYLARLKATGIDAKTYYSPSLHQQVYFHGTNRFGELAVTNAIDDAVLSLPIHDGMNQSDIDLIIETLNG